MREVLIDCLERKAQLPARLCQYDDVIDVAHLFDNRTVHGRVEQAQVERAEQGAERTSA